MGQMASPLAIRFSEETMELMRFTVSMPDTKYHTLADFVREAVEQKMVRERARVKYNVVRKALADFEEEAGGEAGQK